MSMLNICGAHYSLFSFSFRGILVLSVAVSVIERSLNVYTADAFLNPEVRAKLPRSGCIYIN